MTVQELGETLTCPLIFGPTGSLYLLGATALETFGVDADPVGKRLKPIAADRGVSGEQVTAASVSASGTARLGCVRRRRDLLPPRLPPVRL